MARMLGVLNAYDHYCYRPDYPDWLEDQRARARIRLAELRAKAADAAITRMWSEMDPASWVLAEESPEEIAERAETHEVMRALQAKTWENR